jgi:integrase
MAKSGMNPKSLQYIMGHSEIGVTLNTYTHLGYDDAEAEMQKVTNALSGKATTHRKKRVS